MNLVSLHTYICFDTFLMKQFSQSFFLNINNNEKNNYTYVFFYTVLIQHIRAQETIEEIPQIEIKTRIPQQTHLSRTALEINPSQINAGTFLQCTLPRGRMRKTRTLALNRIERVYIDAACSATFAKIRFERRNLKIGHSLAARRPSVGRRNEITRPSRRCCYTYRGTRTYIYSSTEASNSERAVQKAALSFVEDNFRRDSKTANRFAITFH